MRLRRGDVCYVPGAFSHFMLVLTAHRGFYTVVDLHAFAWDETYTTDALAEGELQRAVVSFVGPIAIPLRGDS